MPRNQNPRKIAAPPRFKGFRPYGCRKHNELAVELLFEEYEAIKLADYKLMNHQEAALLMGISRPTFARIYEAARRKIAMALVETREIVSVTGNSFTDKSWYSCNSCHARFTLSGKQHNHHCPLCISENIEAIIN